jgi:16S rRNA (uracil1498-N3)-methyltransferase
MVPRLYVPSLGDRGGTVDLPAEEAGHLQRVLRVKPGAAVRLFDGRGREVAAHVTLVGRDRVLAEIGGPVEAAAEWGVRVTLAQALLKGDKIDDVIRDAVMMGAAAIQPTITARTDVPWRAARRAGRVERWQRVAVSSAKQCGRAVVPGVHAPLSLREALAAAGGDALKLILVEPSAAHAVQPAGLPAVAPVSAVVLVGPEGGWADEDLAAAREAACVPFSLGSRTLRADAAAIVALSVLQYVWG